MKFCPVLLSGAILASSGLLNADARYQGATFRAGTHVVTIDVSVRRQKSPVLGLTAADFELLDNGVPQLIETQSVDTVPVDVTVIASAYDAQFWGTRVAGNVASFAGWLRPIDRLRLISYARDVREVVALQTAAQWKSDGIVDAIWQREDGVDPRHDPARNGHSLFDALLLALARPPELGRRHLVVPFCYQVEFGSALSDGPFLESLAGRTDALLQVAFWTGRMPGAPYDTTQGQYVRQTLRAAAEATGGTLNDVSAGLGSFKTIFDNFRQSYVLQYTARGVPTGGWHTISVRLPKFPQYVVQARKGYMGR